MLHQAPQVSDLRSSKPANAEFSLRCWNSEFRAHLGILWPIALLKFPFSFAGLLPRWQQSVLKCPALLAYMDVRWGPAPAEPFNRVGCVRRKPSGQRWGTRGGQGREVLQTCQVGALCFPFLQNPRRACHAKRREGVRGSPDTTEDERVRLERVQKGRFLRSALPERECLFQAERPCRAANNSLLSAPKVSVGQASAQQVFIRKTSGIHVTLPDGNLITFSPLRSGCSFPGTMARFSRVFSDSWNAPGALCFMAFRPYTKSSGSSDARIPQNFLTTPAHGLGWRI